ncbi:tyrosine-type recombinase/integrase [Roseburia hominis]
MAQPKTYQEQTYIDNTLRLRDVLKTMPEFAKDYFRAIEPTTSPRTRISYAYDIRTFFQFLLQENPVFKNYTMNDFKPSDLEMLSPVDIEEYQEYLKVYKSKESNRVTTNTEKGLSRKMSALRSFYAYYYKHEIIEKNPTLLVDMPKLHDKAIIRLESDEVASLLDHVEKCGAKLTGQARVYYEKTRERDLAILTLLLGTGIRVSECVGLDIGDIDFKNNGITVTRKGGNQMVVYFGDEVEKALRTYLETTRKAASPLPGEENALFLSTQKKRMGVQAVENMVKKYARRVTPNKKITPHKLRSTYGTSLYKETGDIYLVADVLGHKDVNTTKKHYAAIDEDRRRSAANIVKLREP